MSDHPKSPATILLDKLGAALAGAVAAGVVYILASLGGPIVSAIAAASTKEFLVRLSALLGFLLLLALAYILHLRSQARKPLSSKFDFNEAGGYYTDRKTGHHVCPRCLAEGAVTHLKKHAPGTLWCHVCSTAYVNPTEQAKAKSPNTALEPTRGAP